MCRSKSVSVWFLKCIQMSSHNMCAIYNIHTPSYTMIWNSKANIHIHFSKLPKDPFPIKRPLSRRFSSEWSVATPSVARFPHLPPAFFAPWRPAPRRPRSRFRVRQTWLESACWWWWCSWWCLNWLVELPVNQVEDLQFLSDSENSSHLCDLLNQSLRGHGWKHLRNLKVWKKHVDDMSYIPGKRHSAEW